MGWVAIKEDNHSVGNQNKDLCEFLLLKES
jgi:hypothetical protein